MPKQNSQSRVGHVYMREEEPGSS